MLQTILGQNGRSIVVKLNVPTNWKCTVQNTGNGPSAKMDASKIKKKTVQSQRITGCKLHGLNWVKVDGPEKKDL